MTVRGSNTTPLLGRSMPMALNSARRPTAAPTPPTRPASDPATAMASDSPITADRIWRREAPRVRSSPNSRMRWATVIENVLKIRNAATTVTTPPNTSRMVRSTPRKSWLISSVSRVAYWSAVSTRTLRGSSAPDAVAQRLGVHAVVAGHEQLVELAPAVGDPGRLGQRQRGRRAARRTTCRRSR